MICSYLLWPCAYVMGVPTGDCGKVAGLIGVKVFVNEFVAFTELGVYIDNTDKFNRYTGNWTMSNDDIFLIETNTTLVGGIMDVRLFGYDRVC